MTGPNDSGEHAVTEGRVSRLTRAARWRLVIVAFLLLGAASSIALWQNKKDNDQLRVLVVEQNYQLQLICEASRGNYRSIDQFLRDFKGYIDRPGVTSTQALDFFNKAIEANQTRLRTTALPGCEVPTP